MGKWIVLIGLFMFCGFYNMQENPSSNDLLRTGIIFGSFGAVIAAFAELWEYFSKKKEITNKKEIEMADIYYNSFNNPDNRVTIEQVNGYVEWRKHKGKINEYTFSDHIRTFKLNKNWINAIVLIAGACEIFNIVSEHINLTKRVSGRGSTTYITADFQNTILILIATISVVAIILYVNRKK